MTAKREWEKWKIQAGDGPGGSMAATPPNHDLTGLGGGGQVGPGQQQQQQHYEPYGYQNAQYPPSSHHYSSHNSGMANIWIDSNLVP